MYSPPSSRSSLSVERSTVPVQRRNKSALRDYYKLSDAISGASPPFTEALSARTEEVPLSQFDSAGFDAKAFVADLLDTSGMHDILHLESVLTGDIRGLDGERKALVYDNYSKLIAATDTIRRMRSSMEPLEPTTESLNPSIAKIEQMSTELSADLRGDLIGCGSSQAAKKTDRFHSQKDCAQPPKRLVRWVLASPSALEAMVRQGKQEEAKKLWKDVEALLDTWNDVSGVDNVRSAGRAAINS